MSDLESSEARAPSFAPAWDVAPLGELIDHILSRYHARLRTDLDSLVALAQRVLQIHGPRDATGAVEQLEDAAVLLRDELLLHLQKEEQVLFPWLRAGRGRTAGAPVAVMQHEHRATTDILRHIKELSGNSTASAGACAAWTSLLALLDVLASDLQAHFALEDTVLFPRALAG